ncbi:uncharacterized protein LOC122028709 [Zingiber officinale]|uniref:uncharacterized protein LOC122028709 n=1 Tax=Zingiber officinale TaxID=94328 RepID=UPI001C4D4CC2|nr:uncharacterized protein LOC122028709 [Zingiber officinale]
MARLAPLSEEPIGEEQDSRSAARRIQHSFHNWLKTHLPLVSNKKNDLKILLSVLGCPLSPLSVSPKNHLPRHAVASSAQYIIQQFRATTGCAKRGRTAKSMYASGRVWMEMVHEHGLGTPGAASKGHHRKGCFVVWQMVPDMWLVELAVSGHQISAGSDGKVAWRRTPWLGAHAARGGARPLRRALQGLDPETIAAVFSPAQHVGEKHIGDEECFVLELMVENSILSSWSDSTADIIKHRMVGLFSQRSGLLVRLEDSQLTRIQSPGAEAIYWETTISSSIDDYRRVDDLVVAHSGRSTVNLLRFGVGVKDQRVLTRMEERWTIDDVLFDVPGLSADCFIPPAEVQRSCCFYDDVRTRNVVID